MHEKQRDSGRGKALTLTRVLLVGIPLAVVGTLLALPHGADAKREATKAAAAATNGAAAPSKDFRRANWSAPAPEDEASVRESFFAAEREVPMVAPETLENLKGTEIVFPVPEGVR